MDRLCLARDVYDEIARTVGSIKAEQGGALGWREDERVVRYFWFDDTATSTGATYSPDDTARYLAFADRLKLGVSGAILFGKMKVKSVWTGATATARVAAPPSSRMLPRGIASPNWV